MSETSLTKEFRDVTSAANSRIRDLVMQVSDKSLRDKLLNVLRLRATGPSHLGKKRVTRKMTTRLRKLVRSFPDSGPDRVTDRELVQRYNLAIGDVSKARRNTNR